MSAKPSKQLEIQEKWSYRRMRFTTICRTLDSVIRTLARAFIFSVIFYYIFQAIKELAGKETEFNSAIEFFGSFSAPQWFGWFLAAVLGVTNYKERRLRKKQTDHLSETKNELELQLDPDRTTSNLTGEGTHREENSV